MDKNKMSKKKKIIIITVSITLAVVIATLLVLAIVFWGRGKNGPDMAERETFFYGDFECKNISGE